MTPPTEANDAIKAPTTTEQPDLFNSLTKSDWQQVAASPTAKTSSEATASSLSFSDDIYGLNKTATSLTADVEALDGDTKGSAQYSQDKAKVDADETTLHGDVMTAIKDAPDFTTFSGALNSLHTELKTDATTLWKDGFRTEAGDTTAYFPVGQYAKEFANRDPGNPGGGGDFPIAPPAGSTAYNNLDVTSNQHVNTIASEIGGTGNITSDSVTQDGNGKIDYKMTGGAWGDILWRSDIKTPQADNAKQLQLNDTFSLSTEQLKNVSEVEKDLVFQKADGTWGTLGSQINTKTGEVDFWSSTKSEWVNEGSLGPLEANKDYNLQIGATINDTGNPNTGSYTYDYYSLNGQKLDSTENTFATKKMNWAPGVYLQSQLDFGKVANGSVGGMTDSDETINIV